MAEHTALFTGANKTELDKKVKENSKSFSFFLRCIDTFSLYLAEK